jgi:hypothetical protein
LHTVGSIAVGACILLLLLLRLLLFAGSASG